MGQLITLGEAADTLGIPSKAVKRPQNRLWEILPDLLKQGFPARKLGRRWMVDAQALRAWIERHWVRAA